MNKTKVKRAQAMKDVPVVFILVQLWISLTLFTLGVDGELDVS
jgi:hypothetical protein